jgi:hypothetical protein
MISPALRTLILSLALASSASAQIHTLGPGVDLNDALNLNDGQLVAWRGGNWVSFVAIDPVKSRLVRLTVDFPTYSRFEETLMENLPWSRQVLVAELDSHPGAEVILLAGNKDR